MGRGDKKNNGGTGGDARALEWRLMCPTITPLQNCRADYFPSPSDWSAPLWRSEMKAARLHAVQGAAKRPGNVHHEWFKLHGTFYKEFALSVDVPHESPSP